MKKEKKEIKKLKDGEEVEIRQFGMALEAEAQQAEAVFQGCGGVVWCLVMIG